MALSNKICFLTRSVWPPNKLQITPAHYFTLQIENIFIYNIYIFVFFYCCKCCDQMVSIHSNVCFLLFNRKMASIDVVISRWELGIR